MMRLLVLMVGLLGANALAAEIYGASEQSFAFEFKLGPYMPLIDRDEALTTDPYYATYGNAPMLMGELELDYQFWRPFGSIAVGFTFGYAEKFAPAIDATTLTPATESTGLRVFPMKLLAVYRWDWAANKHNIPLVPYLKAGFVAEPWWVVKGGKTETADGREGTGVRFGVAATIGLALQIDFLDPRLARDFDTSAGVNHTYLFAEWTITEVNNFGAKTSKGTATGLDLSSRSPFFGLAVEF
ncbi:MAG: hypothetical protein H6Q89_1192 [Myxococcaceae bacterium]|nr:hypothetical protein [Myxococcaceae bacterium]